MNLVEKKLLQLLLWLLGILAADVPDSKWHYLEGVVRMLRMTFSAGILDSYTGGLVSVTS